MNFYSSYSKMYVAVDCIIFGFDDDDETSVSSISEDYDANGEFYTLTGVKLEGKPTQKGVYIQNGNKVFIK